MNRISIIIFLGIIILGTLVLSQLKMTEGFNRNASPTNSNSHSNNNNSNSNSHSNNSNNNNSSTTLKPLAHLLSKVQGTPPNKFLSEFVEMHDYLLCTYNGCDAIPASGTFGKSNYSPAQSAIVGLTNDQKTLIKTAWNNIQKELES